MANLLSLNGKVVGGGAGGSGGGHAIENSSGTTLTQRDTLQFAGLNATDDSINAKTVVDVFQDAMSLEDFEDAQNLGEGIYPITSDDSTVITADMVDYDGTNTVSDTLDALTTTDRGTVVDITSYTTSAGAYEFPSDGYLYVGCVASGATIQVVLDSGAGQALGNIMMSYGTSYSIRQMIYVRKGLHAYVKASNGNVVAQFSPLVPAT